MEKDKSISEIINKYNKKIKRAALVLFSYGVLSCVLSVNTGEFIDNYTDIPFKVYKNLGGTDRKKYHEYLFGLSSLGVVLSTYLNLYLVKTIYERKREEEIRNMKDNLEGKLKDE
jgi:hypothetical protein